MKKLTLINSTNQDFWKMPESFLLMIQKVFSHWEIRFFNNVDTDLHLLKDAHALIGQPIPASLIRGNQNLEWVHFTAAQIPLSWQKLTSKYLITNSRVGGKSVAEHALYLILKGVRGEVFHHEKSWNTENYQVAKLSSELSLGIVGFGNIGEHLAHFTLPLFSEVRFLTNRPTAPKQCIHHSYREIAQFFNHLDVVVLCTSLSRETQECFNDPQIYKHFKKDLMIINVSRGELFVEQDLVSFLEMNTQAKYLTDVTTPEPYPATGALLKLPNCYLTPHIGARFNSIWEKLTLECQTIFKDRDV